MSLRNRISNTSLAKLGLGLMAMGLTISLSSAIAIHCNNVVVDGQAHRFGQVTPPGLGQVNTDSNFSGNGKSATPLKLVGGTGNTGQLTTNSFGVKIPTFSGTLLSGEVVAYAGDPNTHVTADIGSLCMDYSTPGFWINTNSSSAWTAIATGTSITTQLNAQQLEWFGTGADASPSFDGSTTVLGMAPSSSVYTMTRDIYLDSPTCSSGVTIKSAGFRIFVKTDFGGPASGTCTLSDVGNSASTNTAGTGGRGGVCAGGTGLVGGGAQGGNGKTVFSGGDNGTVSVAASCSPYLAGDGGKGGSDPGVANGGVARVTTCAAFGAINGSVGNIEQAMRGTGVGGTAACMTGGSGGSGGGRNSTGSGISGGGGAGGGYIVVSSKHFTNPTHVTITAAGGIGAAASSCSGGNSSGGGGGGGGGYAVLVIGYGTSPTLTAAGGTGGAGCGATGTAGDPGGTGQALTFRVI